MEELDLSERATYLLATNDFAAAVGDGYSDCCLPSYALLSEATERRARM